MFRIAFYGVVVQCGAMDFEKLKFSRRYRNLPNSVTELSSRQCTVAF